MKWFISTIVFFLTFSFTCANAQMEYHAHAVQPHSTNEVEADGLKFLLIAQYEVTTYKVAGIMIANRNYQRKQYEKGERTQKEPTRYTEFIKEYLPTMATDAADDPQFFKAKKNFEAAPLSFKALAQLAPFLQRSMVRHTTIFDDQMAANFFARWRNV